MDHYVDIDVRPDPEFPAHQLMSALYAKLHRALVAQGGGRLGVSFPGVQTEAPYLGLGTRLRLHGGQVALSALLATEWLTGMRDHVRLEQVAPVPPGVQYRAVQRVQTTSNPDRLRRRLMRRHGLDADEARVRIPDAVACFTDLPYLQLRSTSTGQSFRLFIKHSPLQSAPVSGDFNAYGLSQGGTIPWF